MSGNIKICEPPDVNKSPIGGDSHTYLSESCYRLCYGNKRLTKDQCRGLSYGQQNDKTLKMKKKNLKYEIKPKKISILLFA